VGGRFAEAARRAVPGRFSGKVLFIYLRGEKSSHPSILYDWGFRTLHGRTFLVAKALKYHPAQWDHNKTIWIPWDAVLKITEFDSVEDYRQRAAAWKAKAEASHDDDDDDHGDGDDDDDDGS